MTLQTSTKKLDQEIPGIVHLPVGNNMTIRLEIPDSLATGPVRLAQSSGQTPEEVALSAIQKRLESIGSLNFCLEPIRNAFKASGLTEDKAVALFEEAKHSTRSQSTR